MKLIIAILNDSNHDPVSHALNEANLRVTTIASTGGFLRRGISTLLIGLEDEQVEDALKIVRENVPQPRESGETRATIFVLKVDRFIHY